MLATLGPDSLNLHKFTPWSTTLHALGLLWDLNEGHVSMPAEKIHKAKLRVQRLAQRKVASRNDIEKTLGSLRHVCSCIRAARAFYQNLQQVLHRFPRFGTHRLPPSAVADLSWFMAILDVGHLVNVPTSIFAGMSTPEVTLEMDASDEGLAIMFPARRLFIVLTWDAAELDLIAKCKARVAEAKPSNEIADSTSPTNPISPQ
ncbi:hypothetical protein H310_15157, partial [Aphanomyces invadans]